MTDFDGAQRPVTISAELAAEIRKKAIEEVAKYTIAAAVGFVLIAGTGWWLYLEPKIQEYIGRAAGGVPAGAILASSVECKSLAGKWEPFMEGTGRFLVGAGEELNPGYSNWTLEGGPARRLSQYKVMDLGGEERHLIKIAESPQVIPLPRGDYGGGHDTGGTERVDIKQQTETINLLPPYVGVFFCKRK